MKLLFTIFFISTLTVCIFSQTTRHVPSQYSTIQLALNACQAGDTVLVQPGVHMVVANVNIFPDVTLVLMPGTTIKSSSDGRFVVAGSIVAIGTAQDSITFTSQNIGWRGFNFLEQAPNATLDEANNLISGSMFKYCKFSNLVPYNQSEIGSSNLFLFCFLLDGSTPFFSNCTFTNNSGGNYLFDGLIYSKADSDDTLKIINSSFFTNDVAVLIKSKNLKMSNTIFKSNKSVYILYSLNYEDFHNFQNVEILNNKFKNSRGFFFGGNVHILNTIIYSNSVDYGLINLFNNSTMSNCTIANNEVLEERSDYRLISIEENSIFSNNTVLGNSTAGESPNILLRGGASSQLSNNNIFLDLTTNSVRIADDKNFDFQQNYWGTSSSNLIENYLYDYLDDISLGRINTEPFLLETNTSSPPIPVNNLKITRTEINSIELEWNSSVIADFAGYKIYYDTDTSGYPYSNIIDVGTNTNYIIQGLDIGKRYYINVTNYDIDGNESWYAQEVTAILNFNPNSPQLFSPSNNSSIADTLIPDFVWLSVMDVDSYSLQLSIDNFFDSLLVNADNLVDTLYTLLNELPTAQYFWRVRAKNIIGYSNWSEPFSFTVESTTGIINEHLISKQYSLAQNFPNPFNPNTAIKYAIPKTSIVTLKVYDLLGKEIATLINEEKPIGDYEIDFDGSNLSSGIYFYRIQTGKFTDTKKLILIK